MISGQPDGLWHVYKNRYITCVHQLLAWGYEAIKDKVEAMHEEEQITGWLAKAMDEQLNAPQTPREYQHYSIHEEKPVHDQNRSGKNRQRIDIVITYSQTSPRSQFCCEAKRLKKGSHTIAKYMGAEGLGCFLNDEYAPDQNEAAMLGYIQDASTQHWYSQLNQSLQKAAKKSSSHILEPLSEAKIHSDLACEWTSRHQRSSQNPIDIYHIFFDFTAAQ